MIGSMGGGKIVVVVVVVLLFYFKGQFCIVVGVEMFKGGFYYFIVYCIGYVNCQYYVQDKIQFFQLEVVNSEIGQNDVQWNLGFFVLLLRYNFIQYWMGLYVIQQVEKGFILM